MRSSTPSPPRHSAPVPRERARAGPHQAPLNEGGGALEAPADRDLPACERFSALLGWVGAIKHPRFWAGRTRPVTYGLYDCVLVG